MFRWGSSTSLTHPSLWFVLISSVGLRLMRFQHITWIYSLKNIHNMFDSKSNKKFPSENQNYSDYGKKLSRLRNISNFKITLQQNWLFWRRKNDCTVVLTNENNPISVLCFAQFCQRLNQIWLGNCYSINKNLKKYL